MQGEDVMAEQTEQVQPAEVETSQTMATGAAQAPESSADAVVNEARRPVKPEASIEALKPGMRMKGKVRNVVDFGAFVDVGVNRDGLVHISILKQAGIDKNIKTGDVIDVVVRRIELDSNRISLTLPGAEEAEAEGKASLASLDRNQVVSGRVVRLADFGAFVDIGAQTDGLVHVSQLSNDFVRHPSEVLKVGQEVQVRILEVDTRKRRISLTMKEMTDDDGDASVESAPQGPQERMPTAFEVAFQEAVKRQRRTRK